MWLGYGPMSLSPLVPSLTLGNLSLLDTVDMPACFHIHIFCNRSFYSLRSFISHPSYTVLIASAFRLSFSMMIPSPADHSLHPKLQIDISFHYSYSMSDFA